MYYIYKITNSVNNKIYVGKSTRPVNERFKRHIRDALNHPNSRIHIQRAINKYGADKFQCQEIDTAKTLEELSLKEMYWIKTLDSYKNGYNMTVGGEGGDTYSKLSENQLSDIKNKISLSNKGKNNGMSRSLKCKSVITGEEHIFDTINACVKFFNMTGKGFVIKRANHELNYLWRNEWMFAYSDENYDEDRYSIYDASTKKGIPVTLENLNTNEIIKFSSQNNCLKFLGLKKGSLVNNSIINGYKVKF